jgi:hypothetical protein
VQGDAVALAVEDDGPKSVWAYGVGVLDNAATRFVNLPDGVTDAAFGVKVDEEAARRSDLVWVDVKAAAVALVVLEETHAEAFELMLVDLDGEDRGVELAGAVEVRDGDVKPYRAVVFLVEVGHED